ncbi:hypothetical protein [Ekhidna sp. MALMAid0563]|uniref:hypothetical protein n=1 Tax=Ekhidna sp. MALMAid0563 TaxID=3143937 RepID=UPI0032E04C30
MKLGRLKIEGYNEEYRKYNPKMTAMSTINLLRKKTERSTPFSDRKNTRKINEAKYARPLKGENANISTTT